MVILIVISALGTVTKELVKGLEDLEIRGNWRQSKLQHWWDQLEYWEESWRLEENCCHSDSSEKPSDNADVKNSQGVKTMNLNMAKKGKP